MTSSSGSAFSRRTFIRGAALSVPVVGAAVVAPVALAAPQECGDPSGKVGNCAAQLPQQFSSTSFSTTATAGGTNYSILFSTNIRRGPLIPSGATGYRINSVSVSGTKLDGTPFYLTPGIGEVGPRLLNALSASSLGFALDVPWDPNQLVRSFLYTYDVEFLAGLTGIQTCRYTTTMALADNGMTLGGVGSVTFSTPMLAECETAPPPQ
ncbi:MULTISPECIES: hypothetical protein [unclassified Mycolicibacterium]|uniref:hypothetical protein n=1 Tax=unclassified Mycolicibacterium TaxID=2636767 RepID=UPI001309E079|nr:MULTISPECIES: hypothetical protein [unclassified Mycolicibacterium]MUL82202.1 hypothetical protein [Mycolicibacterium sp. CBMA 329]MUL87968.1 hypothetical protein [Mycolicibacterium sp. CBMA 331]MUM02299.1 hypothetical protein [Mycolicibacterium sp. CBMA 334]MUM26389.1 hypothetical protein [Mycolicibacterium sp. CBMA 295]MUM38265.1 hypothetical protein [Mycolicibacterium sp. CBMA 247]